MKKIFLGLLLSLSATFGAAGFYWDPNPPAEGVEGYFVYFQTTGDEESRKWKWDVGWNLRFYLPITVRTNQPISFIVHCTAYNKAGESDSSDPLSFTPVPVPALTTADYDGDDIVFPRELLKFAVRLTTLAAAL